MNNIGLLYFPRDSNGNINRRLFVDFLDKLVSYTKKIISFQCPLEFEKGPGDGRILTEQSFLNPSHQHFLSNKRWYKYNEDDGRRVWKPTEDYEKDERRVKMFAKKFWFKI